MPPWQVSAERTGKFRQEKLNFLRETIMVGSWESTVFEVRQTQSGILVSL
jgi:hypothetical protein